MFLGSRFLEHFSFIEFSPRMIPVSSWKAVFLDVWHRALCIHGLLPVLSAVWCVPALVAAPSSRTKQAAEAAQIDAQGRVEKGEGNEVVVTRGVVVREVAPEKEGELPRLAVGSASGRHYLFDPNQFALQSLWFGAFGRLDDAGRFLPSANPGKPFSIRALPWEFGERPRRKLQYQWNGHRIDGGRVWFSYRITDAQTAIHWEIEESLEILDEERQTMHFRIQPSAESPEYLNFWVVETDFRRLSTNGQPNQRHLLKNLFPNQKEFSVSVWRRKETPTVPHGYFVQKIDTPEPLLPQRFEPTSFAFSADGSLFVSTRTGSIWRRKAERWTLFADGLHEANGVQIAPDGKSVYVMQKPELTLLRDTNDDGIADHYETVDDRFRFTGNYHEFAYGPKMNSRGELFFSTGLSAGGHHMASQGSPNQMTSALGYRGWVLRKSPDGKLTPFACGLRSPAGIGMNSRDELFVTDNQGDWVASSYLTHVEEGDFLGHPAAAWDRPEYGLTPATLDYKTVGSIPEKVPALDLEKLARERKPPSVWLGHGDLTNSPGHPSFAPPTGFGPFGEQAFIADIAHRAIVRVALEKVGGAYQGAVFPFLRPLSSSSYSTAFDPEGNLWVGSVGRGWTAGDPCIEVVRYQAGQTPFEMHRIALTRDGFDVVFTQPIEPQSIAPEFFSITEYRYQYWEGYGSEPLEEAAVRPSEVRVSQDRCVVSLKLPRKPGFLYQIQLGPLRAESGQMLENNYGIYTLNRLLP